jgi:hypothetical protein
MRGRIVTRDDGLIRTPDGDLVPDVDDDDLDRDRIKAHADEVRRILRESRERREGQR